MEGLLIPPDQFTAGYISEHLDLFKTYFQSMGIKTADSERVLEWLEHAWPYG